MDFGCVISVVGVVHFFISEQSRSVSGWPVRRSDLNVSYRHHHSETFLE